MEDVLSHIFSYMTLEEINRCSEVSKEYNRVSRSEYLWLKMLETDYKDNYNKFIKKTKYETYKGCYNLCKITKYELDKLNGSNILSLMNNNMETIPQEIGQLTNLQQLYLYNNQLTIIPQEIGQLTNLQELYLDNNQQN